MATKNTALRNTLADAFGGVIDRMDILDGATTLATIEISFGSASTGQITADPASVNAVAGGTADGAKLYSSAAGGEEVTGLTVTATGGGGDVELVNTSISSGQPVDFSSITWTEPASTA